MKDQTPAMTSTELISKIDSLYQRRGIGPFRSRQIADSLYLNKVFFEKNRQLAKSAVETSPWAEGISNDVFNEYILPYKIDHELVDNWRQLLVDKNRRLLYENPQLNNMDSLYAYHLRETYYALKSTNEFEPYYPAQANYSWLNLSREGDCSDRCRYVIYHLRAAGLPATYDYIPNWGNRPRARHAYVGLASKQQQLPSLLENKNDPENIINNLNAANVSDYKPKFKANEVPLNLTIQYEKSIPKLYRQTWSQQPAMKALLTAVPEEQIYEGLIRPNMVDVTDQYLKTANLNIWHKPFNKAQIAYLATFDIGGWIPVAFARFNWWGQANFTKMGKNILYLPLTCYNETLLPAGALFILDNEGHKQELACNYHQQIDMKLLRKFPLFSYTAAHVVDLKGCIIYGSNDYRFEEKEQLAIIDHYPFFMDTLKIASPNKYRFVKIESPEGKMIRLAELACFSDSAGVQVRCNDIRYQRGELKEQYRNLFDNKLDSYTMGRALSMDLGKPVSISEIRICPRNDTNYIIPGNQYELFYWDNQWISAGKQTATTYSLNYNKLPSGTLYWLRCLTEGREERTFTYENGKQIWW